MILEETLYLIGLGYKEDNAPEIILGMAWAHKNYSSERWIEICDETLRWHCKNFYELGEKYGQTEEIDRSYIDGIQEFISRGM